MSDHTANSNSAGVGTTGHEWDGLQELNTPLPRWWLMVLYATIVWAIGYWIVYPAWPTLNGYTKGVFGYSSRANVAQELTALQETRSARVKALADARIEDVRNDPALFQFAQAQGKAAFGNNCAPCHGQGAGGAPSFPNLNDDVWIWGGKLSDIQQTVQHGIRFQADAETRAGVMQAFGRDGILKPAEVQDVVSYVLSLNKQPTEGGNAANGAKIFAENCAVCHGENAGGNQELGAPPLNTGIWLYGGDRKTLVETVTNGRGGVMPAWSERLDPVTIKALTVYVHSLGGGK